MLLLKSSWRVKEWVRAREGERERLSRPRNTALLSSAWDLCPRKSSELLFLYVVVGLLPRFLLGYRVYPLPLVAAATATATAATA